MAKEISSLAVKLTANVGEFTSNIGSAIPVVKELGEGVKGAGEGMGKFEMSAGGAALGIAALAAAAVAATVGAIKLAAPYEAATVQLNALCGSTEIAAGLLENLRTFATKSPFEFPELLDTSKRLIAAGVNAAAIPKILNEAGNVAVGVGKPISEIGDIFARVAVEGKVSSRELREFGKDGIPIVQTLAKQFHTTAAGVDQLAESGRIGFTQLESAFDTLTSKGGKFNGILEAQANTVGGKFHTLTATVEDEASKIAEKFLIAFHVGPIIDTLTAAIVKLDKGLMSILDDIGEITGQDMTVPDPPPVKITSLLDPATQQLQIQPVVLPPAVRAGSAEALAARYAPKAPKQLKVAPAVAAAKPAPALPKNPLDAKTTADMKAKAAAWNAAHPKGTPGYNPAFDAFTSAPSAPAATKPQPDTKHAPKGTSSKFGYAGLRTELGDATLGADGYYHVKAGGIESKLTPAQYAAMRAEEKRPDSLKDPNYPKAPKTNGQTKYAAEKQKDNDKLNDWRFKHGLVKSEALDAREGPQRPGVTDPAKTTSEWNAQNANPDPQPKAARDNAAASANDQSNKLDQSNQWLYRIELNTRASGTGAQIVDF